MESRKRKTNLNPYFNSPLPNPQSSSSSIFRDISNLKTPKKHPSIAPPNFSNSPQFFTALKNTPASSTCRGVGVKTSALKSKAALKLKAFELEQSKSARKAQAEKEKSLKSLARSLTVWLNFLFENPSSCGCDQANFIGEIDGSDLSFVGGRTDQLVVNGKRESGSGRQVAIDGVWRGPKRQRDSSWSDEGGKKNELSGSRFSGLRASLHEICSFEDLKERMRMYLSSAACKDILEGMAQVTKNIDEGRLKMRASCPIVSDVGMKEKAMRVLMCYNPIWLRIGLYILLGGESLLPESDVNCEQETAFLRMVIEKQFLSHTGLAKDYAYNKQVEGLYRPGYYEKLGNVILKRFLLLVIILDRAKSHTSLPLKYGIDGKDGGSPLLFSSNSNIKSSRQLIIDFLSSDVMHGEGNLLAHLVIIGYKVTYQQIPLIEYDFKVTDLFEDIQDGVRLCRAIELLKHDSSILMKVVVPSDTQKKNLFNCGIALQYLKKAGIAVTDEDETEVIAEDIVNGDKELTLSLLWNMFVHLQLPLLINRTILSEEISLIRGAVEENSNTQTLYDLLLSWIKAVCETYELKVESQSSLLDGKAMWCLLDYYFRKEHDCSCSFKDPDGTEREVSIMSAIEYTDAVHNFLLTQKLTSLLGNFPEVLQVSDILEHNGACNGQTVVVLLVFLSVQLLVKRNMDKLNFHKLLGFSCQTPSTRSLSTKRNNEQDGTRDFKAIMAWWQDMAQHNGKFSRFPAAFSAQCFLTGQNSSNIQRENAATIIQSQFRRMVERRNYLRILDASLVLQSATLAWLSVRKKVSVKGFEARVEQRSLSNRGKHLDKFGKYVTFMVDRHYFVNLKKSVIIIQQAARAWIFHRHHYGSNSCNQTHTTDDVNAATAVQSYFHGWKARSVFSQRVTQNDKMSEEGKLGDIQAAAAITIQHSWKDFFFRKSVQTQNSAATKIQSHYRGWLMRKSFAGRMQAIRTIQKSFRHLKSMRDFQIHKVENSSAIIIQSHVRGWIARRKSYREKHIFIMMQSYCRGWLQRKKYLLQKLSARRIQCAFQCMKLRNAFLSEKHASIDIQSFIRGENTRKRLFGASCCGKTLSHSFQGLESKIILKSVVKLQKWWRDVLQLKVKTRSTIVIQSHFRGWTARQMDKKEKKHAVATQLQRWWRDVLQVKKKTKAAIVIQSHYRGWMTRQMAKRKEKRAIVIQRPHLGLCCMPPFFVGFEKRKSCLGWRHTFQPQSTWKGYLARKHARGQLLDLRLRMQKSAANVDDSRRLINRLVAALSELLSMRSISNILHICATISVATELSQRCCDELVAAGAIGTFLKLIRSVSRSIPDQQVLKHALSTLRNLARYPHLTEVLVESHGCVEIVLFEFLKNKEEGYFIASELLKRICQNVKGATTIRKSPALLKRLNNLVEELARKAGNDTRNARNLVAKEHAQRRLKEAVELLKLITNA